jgi:cysteine desulfurase
VRENSVYLDYQATSPLDPRALDEMMPYLTELYGNPSSAHKIGRMAADAVREARGRFQNLIGAADETEVIFTSGATESNALAIVGMAQAWTGSGDHVVVGAIEHKAVLGSCLYLADCGFKVTVVPVSADGVVDPAAVAEAITGDTFLVSVMHANHEIGTLQPIAGISEITRERGIILHTDAAQSIACAPFDVTALGVDVASFSAHKFYGPKGVGALYLRKGTTRPSPALRGGMQEYGVRSGTLNVPGIVGLGSAARLVGEDRESDCARIGELRDSLLSKMAAGLPESKVNGSLSRRLPGNISITVPGLDAARLVAQLDSISISTGSACQTGSTEPSHVLTAIGLNRDEARSTLRISVGRFTTREDIDFTAAQLIQQISVMVR